MKPAPFEYVRARSLEHALDCLAGDPEAKLLAGGQSLVPMMNMRLARPSRLVDLNAVPGLGDIRPAPGGGLVIGALARHADLVRSPLVRERAPLLAAAAAQVGHRAIRNRGTLGGSLAHADPAAELPAAVVALDATVVAAGPAGRRRIPAGELFRGVFATALRPDEILVEVEVPDHAGAGWGFAEVARRAGDFAIAGVAAVLHGAAGEPVRSARLVALGADARPVRLSSAERIVAGRALSPDVLASAGRAAAADCDPPDDVHASADYRRHLVTVLVETAIDQARGRRGPAR